MFGTLIDKIRSYLLCAGRPQFIPADSDSGGRPGLVDILRRIGTEPQKDRDARLRDRVRGEETASDFRQRRLREPYLPSVVWYDARKKIRSYVRLNVSGSEVRSHDIARFCRVSGLVADISDYVAVWDGGLEPGAEIHLYDVSLETAAILWVRLRHRFKIHCAGIQYVRDNGDLFTGCIRSVCSDAWIQAQGIPTREDDGLDN